MFYFISTFGQLTCKVGWVVGNDQAVVSQLAGLSVEPSHPAARMRKGGWKSQYMTEQRVPARFVLCWSLLTFALPLNSWEALGVCDCM